MSTEAHTQEEALLQGKSTRRTFFQAFLSAFSQKQKQDSSPVLIRLLLRVPYNELPTHHHAVLRDHITLRTLAGQRVIIEVQPQEIPVDCIGILVQYAGTLVSRSYLKLKVTHVEKISLEIQHGVDKALTVFEPIPHNAIVVVPSFSSKDK